MRTFFRTAAALRQYDAYLDALVKDDQPCTYLVAEQQGDMILQLERSVGTAFYEDTKDINRLQDCISLTPGPKHGDLGFIRRVIKTWEENINENM